MKQPQALKSAALVTVTAAATTFLIQACGGGDAVAQSAPDPIVGVWESTVTQKNCATGEVIATFKGAQVFHAGGTLTDTNGAAPTSRGPGFGVWTNNGANYTAAFRFFRFNTDGSLAGTQVVTRTVTLSVDGNTATGATQAKILDIGGTVLQQICAADTSTRFHA